METRKINQRADEPENPYSYQITFRTSRVLSGRFSSLRGLCKKYGHNEKTPELFEKVILPAMMKYVSDRGYIDLAKADK